MFNICIHGEEKIKLNAPEKAGKLTRNIPGKMVENQLLSGIFWFIDWNLIFNHTGLFLPKKYAYWLFGNLKRPILWYLREIFAVCVLKQVNVLFLPLFCVL